MPEADVFTAIASPVRRRILDLLCERERAVTDLAASFEMSRPAVSQHLGVLRSAGLVRCRTSGREHYYTVDATPLAEVRDWLDHYERFWTERLEALSELLDGIDD